MLYLILLCPYILSGDENSGAGKVIGVLFGVGVVAMIAAAVVWTLRKRRIDRVSYKALFSVTLHYLISCATSYLC